MSSDQNPTALPISLDDVRAAAGRLAGVARRTPVMTSATADGLVGAKLYFKCENLQRMGAFKFRGAYNALAQFDDGQRKRGVVAFSSGNHAQAVALAARILGIPATIVMPKDAPAVKIAATRGYGGEIVLYDRYAEDREAIGARLAAERGLTLVPPYDHAQVMAGQGTAALELIEEVGGLDVLMTPMGGGGLVSGCATAAKGLLPSCAVYAVEPEAGDDGRRSFREGRIVHIDTPATIADGAQTQHLGKLTFPVVRALVDDVLVASDAELVEAMRFLAGRMKLVVEPTGSLAAAAAFAGRVDLKGKRVGIVLSGGNVDLARYATLLKEGAGA